MFPLSLRFATTLATYMFALLRVGAESVFTINLTEEPREISPLIYGLNDWMRNETTESTGFTLERMGGNRVTSYNWENNFSNAGNDYIHHSDNLLVNTLSESDQTQPGAGIMLSVDHAQVGGRPSLLTLQLAGYVAADENGTVDESQRAPSLRWKEVKVSKGAAYSLNPDTADDFVYLDEQVNFLIETYGKADEGGVFAYSLDNEPALWASTHARIHPEKPGAEEIISKNAAAAAMIKNLDKSALVFGPALYGWGAYQDFQSAPDWSSFSGDYDWFVSAYLGEMRKLSEAAGGRLLDVLDLHFYSEVAVVTSTDANGNDVYTRVTDSESNFEPLTQARLQSTRSLWDGSFVEESWVTQWSTQGQPLNMISRVNASIDQHYPGTKLSISEYDFGGHQNYSGGLAQVDALGIFGSNGIYAACFWGEVTGFIAPAFRMFRDFDGEGNQFGDIGLATTNPDTARFSSYASINSETGTIHVILINKTAEAEDAILSFNDLLEGFASMETYGFSEATGPNIVKLDTREDIRGDPVSVELPARSAMHYVLQLTPSSSFANTPQLVIRDNTGDFYFRFQAEFGHRYQLQESEDLKIWDDLNEPIFGLGQELEKKVQLSSENHFWKLVPEE